jgi:hypothetical protein
MGGQYVLIIPTTCVKKTIVWGLLGEGALIFPTLLFKI